MYITQFDDFDPIIKTACSNIDVKHSRRGISNDDTIVTRNETRKSLASSVVIQTKVNIPDHAKLIDFHTRKILK